MLNSHPDIICHGEVFTHAIPRLENPEIRLLYSLEQLGEMRSNDPPGFLTRVLLDAGGCRAVGAKIKYSELESENWPGLFKAILSDQDIRIIHLTRENLLKRFVSHCLAARTNFYNSWETGERPPLVKLKLGPEACVEDIKRIEAAEQRFREHFRSHQVFEITYEDALARISDKRRALQRFLDVRPLELTPRTQKLNPDILEDLLENYAEIKTVLGTSHANYFD